MNRALIVDIQYTGAEAFPNGNRRYYLDRLKELGTPVHIALTPYQRDQWKDLQDPIGELVSREGSGLLLEGLLHVCSHRNHTIRDPHHQGICTSFLQRNTSTERQLWEIEEGADFLKRIFGVDPIGYVPSQHLWNQDTLKAVGDAGMSYLITNAMFSNMYPYTDRVTVVPSGSVKHGKTENPVIHVYYDRFNERGDFVERVAEDAVPLSEIPIGKKTMTHAINQQAIRLTKQIRDGRRLINWLKGGRKPLNESSHELRRARSADYQRHKKEVFQY